MRRVALVAAGTLAFAVPAGAAEAPTIAANPSVVGTGSEFVLSGTVPSREAGERVEIEAKECRGTFFRLVAATATTAGGAWTVETFVDANTAFRARWKDAASVSVAVKRRAFVGLARRSKTVVVATVVTPYQKMVGRTIRLERHTPEGWVLLGRAKLRNLGGPVAETRFLVRRRGLQLRALLPDAAAKPCYVAGVSTIIRS